MTLKEAAEYAPLVTASVAALAPLVAVVSILVQKGIARKRAAIDFFLKTEMDNEVFNDYAKSRSFSLLLSLENQWRYFAPRMTTPLSANI